MPALGQLPTSNPAGNNQTSPPTGGIGPKATPIFQPVPTSSGTQPVNSLLTGLPPAVPGSTSPATGAPTSQVPSTGLYDTSSSYSNGQTNIDKQLVDIYGKGIGGSLDNLLKNMSGSDSEIFKQWLVAQQPAQASERADLASVLGRAGVSANSSVSAIANSSLESSFNAQAAQENANLMTQNIQDTLGILDSSRGAAAKEVASSGWDVFANVMANITGDVGNLLGGNFHPESGGGGGAFAGETPAQIQGATSFAGDGSGIATSTDFSADSIFI